MSPTQELLVVALGLYLFECVLVVPRAAVLFVARGLAKLRIVPADALVGTPTRGVFLAMPLPPLGLVFVCDPWALAVAPDGVCALPGGRFGGPPPAEPPPAATAWTDIRDFAARGSRLHVNDLPILECASAAGAQVWQAVLRDAHAAPAGRRAAVLADALRARLDPSGVASVVSEVRAAVRGLRLAGNALLAYLFLVAPLVVWRYGFVTTWLPLLAGLLPLWVAAVAAYYHAHRRQFPQRRAERRLHALTSSLLPLAAIRGVDALTRDALAGFHPAAVAAVLCPADTFRAYLQAALGDARFSPPPGDERVGRIRAWFRAQVRDGLERLAWAHGLDPAELLSAPEPDEAACRSWCPRCRGQYVVAAEECPVCPGVPLRGFAAPPAAEERRP